MTVHYPVRFLFYAQSVSTSMFVDVSLYTVTCRQFLDLTFAPRKTCLIGSNLALLCYHVTARYTIHYLKRKCKYFFKFFSFFSRALPRKCITGALANSGLPLIHRRRFGERLCRHPFSACPLRIEFHTITLTARSNRMPRKAHSPQRQPKLLIASQSYLAPITFQRYLIVHKQINKIVFRQSHQNSWKTIC